MAEERVQRRLAAVLAADVVGYSRMIHEDEAGTRSRFNAHLHELIEPTVSSRDGRIVKTTGDGILVEFTSVVDAVDCAIEIQNGVSARNSGEVKDQQIQFRIGVNLGDVIIEGEDIHGDGVNIAARLEGLAEPGGVCVSGIVHESVRNHLKAAFIDLGEQAIKNIPEPVRVYAVKIDPSDNGTDPFGSSEAIFRLPSIAVLPFENMSGDPSQEYFSDGITEDLITALSRIRQLRVIARNSTFAYKGQSPDIRKVSKELAAQYVIEGSVRKAGDRIRLTAQLIDGVTGNHLWAERYDRDLSDVFAVQDELTETLIGAISERVGRIERERSRRKPPENLDAWDLYQRGTWYMNRRTKEDNEVARALFERATKLDPEFAPAHAGFAQACCYDVLFGFAPGDHEVALQAARTAVNLDSEDATAHVALGIVHYVGRDHEAALPEFERAIELNPSFAYAHYYKGNILLQTGQAAEGLPFLHNAIRLSPNDDLAGPYYARIAFAHFCLRDHESAIDWARKAIRSPTGTQWPVRTFLVSALAHLGRNDEAQVALQELQNFSAGITTGFVEEHIITKDPDYRDHLIEGLRKAGLPEN